ncbi:O-antigen ligase family protein, partial [Parabacteroides goldsteinii]
SGGATTHLIRSGTRYFSFFTDASNMGSNMGGASMILGISSLFMRNKAFKIYYAIVATASLYAMMLSGTRGAIIVPLAGLALYTVISKQTRSILIGTISLTLIYIFFAFTMIGQGNATIRRMRTAFKPNEDASYIVRKENQKRLKEYLKYKPFGEGLGLSGDGLGAKVSKRFTTSIPTDSWYVKIWVETGVVGLILYMGMILITIARGTWILMFNVHDPELKGILTGWLCAIFGMFLSAYGNSFWGQFPTMVIAFMGLSFILNGKYFDKELSDKIKNYS